MSGTMDWDAMYATEDGLGIYFGGYGTAACPGCAVTYGDVQGAWDMDWSWGSELIPLQYPGFLVEYNDLGGGQFHVTLTPWEEPSSVVGLNTEVPQIVAISVSPSNIDFGALYPGQSSSASLLVSNIGTVTVDIDAEAYQEGQGNLFTDHMEVNGAMPSPWIPLFTGLGVSANTGQFPVTLHVPQDYEAQGPETGALVFEAYEPY
jgi:hypothetical protein